MFQLSRTNRAFGTNREGGVLQSSANTQNTHNYSNQNYSYCGAEEKHHQPKGDFSAHYNTKRSSMLEDALMVGLIRFPAI